MKRLNIHVLVARLDPSVRFYSALLTSESAVVRPDYAKWMLDDPRMNFAISTRGGKGGLDHPGIQVETPDELGDVHGRLRRCVGNMAARRGRAAVASLTGASPRRLEATPGPSWSTT